MRTAGKEQREPLRLLRRRGSWSLEFTRLVAVDEQLMRPERRSIAATAAALAKLAPSCPPERVREAEELMHAVDDGSDRGFELADEGWAPLPPVTQSQRPLARGELTAVVTELRAELVVLRALHEALLVRVAELERAGVARKREAEPQRSVQRVPSRRALLESLNATAAAPPPAPSPIDPPRASAPVEPQAAPAAESTPGETPAGPSLALPSQADVAGCVQLLAPDVVLTLVSGPLPADLSEVLGARLAADSGEALGVVLVDRRAQAMLGGGLLGVPKAAREEQGRRGLDNDVLEAFNEVLNNLGGLVNRVNPACYTRLGALERLDSDALPWLARPRSKLGFALPSGGALWFAAR